MPGRRETVNRIGIDVNDAVRIRISVDKANPGHQ
jgi:hypothetical protein